MEPTSQVLLSDSSEDKNAGELLAQWLRANKAPDVVMDQLDKLIAELEMKKQEIAELRAENLYLQSKISRPKYFIMKDLDMMVLQRVQPESLPQVSRVQKSWKLYIAANYAKMRSQLVDEILIDLASESPVQITHFPKQEDELCMSHHRSFKQMLKYKPQTLELAINDLELHLIGKHVELLKSLPDWWFKQIKKISCYLLRMVDPMSYFPLVLRCSHLSELRLHVFTDDFIPYIEIAPLVDRFYINTHGCLVPHDRLLEAVLKKSAEFPSINGISDFTLSSVIRFIEKNQFPCSGVHLIHVYSNIRGKKEDWEEWMRLNATMIEFSQLHSSEIEYLKLHEGIFVHNAIYSRWKFSFRNERFDAIMGEFI